MTPDIDIWRAANLLMKQHGEIAEIVAARRADLMLERGDPEGRLVWLRIRRAIVELQAAFHHALPQAHLRFFRDLQPSFACGDFFFAHAGVRPGVELSRQIENDLLWIRDEFLSSDEDFGKIVIHGHTPTHEVEVEPNRINIDTGAFATGRLTCLVIEDQSLSVIDTL